MKTAALSKTNMAYVDEGAGVPVLLVHGFPLDHTMWDAQIDALSGRARVIAPDLRGFGQTPLAPGDAERGISMEAYADDLAELLDKLGDPRADRARGLFDGRVRRVAVRAEVWRAAAGARAVRHASQADTEEARAGRLKMAENVAEWGSGRVAEMMGPKLFAPATFEKKPEVVAAVRAVVERTPPAGIAAAQRGMAARPDVTSFAADDQAADAGAGGRARRDQPAGGNERDRRRHSRRRVCRDSPRRAHDDDGRAGGGQCGVAV